MKELLSQILPLYVNLIVAGVFLMIYLAPLRTLSELRVLRKRGVLGSQGQSFYARISVWRYIALIFVVCGVVVYYFDYQLRVWMLFPLGMLYFEGNNILLKCRNYIKSLGY